MNSLPDISVQWNQRDTIIRMTFNISRIHQHQWIVLPLAVALWRLSLHLSFLPVLVMSTINKQWPSTTFNLRCLLISCCGLALHLYFLTYFTLQSIQINVDIIQHHWISLNIISEYHLISHDIMQYHPISFNSVSVKYRKFKNNAICSSGRLLDSYLSICS